MPRTRLLGQQERVHWTGLHRLLDSTTGMVSMPRTRLLGQQERGRKKHTERIRVRVRCFVVSRRLKGCCVYGS